jgi:hypothetical protein
VNSGIGAGPGSDVLLMFQRAIFLRGFGGLFFYVIFIGIIQLFASRFAGRGTYAKTATAVGWATVPTVALIILTLIGYLVIGENIFIDDFSVIGDSMVSFVILGFNIIKIILGIWSFVIMVATVAEVHKLSTGNSLASIVLTIISIVGVLFVLILLVGGNINLNF